ncbi:MAG: pyridoxamine 5'-phosphate oxidase family protein [Gaiellaceae bacterium]
MSDPLPSTRLEGDAVLADDLARELLGARLVGVLATFDRAHGIHAVPMWYAVIENRILLATGSRSRKVRNLELDPRATLVVHDSRPGYEVCGVSIAGTIEILRGLEAQTLVDRVHGRYVADGAGENAAVRAFLISDDVALRLRPIAALTWDERPSAASAALRARGEAFPLVTTDPR